MSLVNANPFRLPQSLEKLRVPSWERKRVESALSDLFLRASQLENFGLTAHSPLFWRSGLSQLVELLDAQEQVIAKYVFPVVFLFARTHSSIAVIIPEDNITVGQSAVLAGYRVTDGKPYVIKTIEQGVESAIYNHFGAFKWSPGYPLGSVINFRGLQLLKPLNDGSLAAFMKSVLLEDLAVKTHIIKSLLRGLKMLHSLTLDYLEGDYNGEIIQYRDVPFYHGRVALNSVDVWIENGFVNVGWTDFSNSLQVHSYRGRVGYRPPELIALLAKTLNDESLAPSLAERLEYNRQFARANDCWAMGILILEIIANDNAPLNCLRNGIDWSKKPYDISVVTLTQEQLDAELESFPVPAGCETLFNIAKQFLRINPVERISTAEALALFSQSLSAQNTLNFRG